jgi:hypothetical protein
MTKTAYEVVDKAYHLLGKLLVDRDSACLLKVGTALTSNILAPALLMEPHILNSCGEDLVACLDNLGPFHIVVSAIPAKKNLSHHKWVYSFSLN